jgi:Ca2+-binding RTX toxin-like protein
MATTIPSGFPNSSNTGVPAGTKLTPYNGTLHVTTNGAVIENLDINGQIVVDADNVTIRNCRVTTTEMYGICGRPMTIQNCEIDGKGVAPGSYGIMASGTFTGNNIHGFENGIGVADSNTTIKNNYIHDLQAGGADPHYDGIAVQGGEGGEGNIVIENNTIISRDTSDIFIKNDFGPISNVTVNHNFLAGDPGYNIYVDGRASGGPISGVTITDNYLQKGHWGYLSIDNSSPVVSNNHEFLPGDTITVDGGSTGGTGTGGTGTGGTGTGGTGTGGTHTGTTGTVAGADHTFWGTSGNDVMSNSKVSGPSNDTLHGLAGNDVLNGGPGADILDGGTGNDTATYEGSKAGVSVNLTTGATHGGDAQGDRLYSIENLTGSSRSDSLIGDAGANILKGGAGHDFLSGMGGADTLIGGSGNDRLSGGLGNDTLTGGPGNDIFVFNTRPGPSNTDKITDFHNAAGDNDTIQLSHTVFASLGAAGRLKADYFHAGTSAHDANDHVIYDSNTGKLYYDDDGSGAHAQVCFATLANRPANVSAADFVVV